MTYRMRLLLGGGAVAAAALLGLFLLINPLKLGMYRIASGSMEPALPFGTVVVTSNIPKLEVGRAITFEAEGALVTHILVGFNPDGSIRTRGIANQSEDSWPAPIMPSAVRGRVMFQVLLLSPSFWQSWKGGMVIVGVALIGASVWYSRIGVRRLSPLHAERSSRR